MTTETLFTRAAAAGLPEAYVRTLIDAGALDGAVTVDHRVRPHGLAALLLVDELARLRLEGRLTREEAAEVYQSVAPELPDLVGGRDTVCVRVGRRRLVLEFLKRI